MAILRLPPLAMNTTTTDANNNTGSLACATMDQQRYPDLLPLGVPANFQGICKCSVFATSTQGSAIYHLRRDYQFRITTLADGTVVWSGQSSGQLPTPLSTSYFDPPGGSDMSIDEAFSTMATFSSNVGADGNPLLCLTFNGVNDGPHIVYDAIATIEGQV